MAKKCCSVQFRTFANETDYTYLECLIMAMLSMTTTKNPKGKKSSIAIKVLRHQAKNIYDCCTEPSKLNHSFGELYEHVKYINIDNIKNAKEVWAKKNGKA